MISISKPVGSASEYRSHSGVVLRARGTLYAHFDRTHAGAVAAVIAERLRAAGYEHIRVANPAGGTGIHRESAASARGTRNDHALVG